MSVTERLSLGVWWLLTAVVALLIFVAINVMVLPPKPTIISVIERKWVVPAYNQNSVVIGGAVVIPDMLYYPASYHLLFKVYGALRDVEVAKPVFDRAYVGDSVKITLEQNDSYQVSNIEFFANI